MHCRLVPIGALALVIAGCAHQSRVVPLRAYVTTQKHGLSGPVARVVEDTATFTKQADKWIRSKTIRTITTYDARGRMTRRTCDLRRSGGGEAVRYQYDLAGGLRWRAVAESDSFVHTTEYAYDPRTRTVTERVCGGDRELERIVVSKLDRCGNAVEVFSRDPGGELKWRSRMRYDREGNILSGVSYGPHGDVRNRFWKTYTDGGRLVKSFTRGHGGWTTTLACSYRKFDSQRNWTDMVQESLLRYPGRNVLERRSVVHRRITYRNTSRRP